MWPLEEIVALKRFKKLMKKHAGKLKFAGHERNAGKDPHSEPRFCLASLHFSVSYLSGECKC